MRYLRLVPSDTHIDFMRLHVICFALSGLMAIATIGLFVVKGLNLGIDFRGGILIEMRTPEPANFPALRETLSGLNVGEVTLQGFGGPNDVLLRLEAQEGGERGNLRAVQAVREAMGANVEFRRVETVGPTVGEELREAGFWAVIASIAAILVYVWFRFEWQFGVGAIVALFHDVFAIIGLFSILGLDFDLSTLAAILTIGGYSINDTVVVYDRVRENLRKFKRMGLRDLLNRSVNDTLSRTALTGVTTLLALLALLVFGGTVIRNFTIAMFVGVIVGTYSSIFVAAPLLLYLRLKRSTVTGEGEAAAKP